MSTLTSTRLASKPRMPITSHYKHGYKSYQREGFRTKNFMVERLSTGSVELQPELSTLIRDKVSVVGAQARGERRHVLRNLSLSEVVLTVTP